MSNLYDSKEDPPSSPEILPPHLRHTEINRNQRGKWKGEELEMQHFLEHQATHSSRSSSKNNKNTAVDISQFQNTVVGQGYQAKHVIRQKSMKDGNVNLLNIKDMSKPLPGTSKRDGVRDKHEDDEDNDDGDDDDDDDSNPHKRKKKKKKHDHKKSRKRHRRRAESHSRVSSSPIEKYLKCEAMRNFRREMEEVLQSRRS